MASPHFSQMAAFIWSVADLLRGDFKQSQYGRIILPFTLLRRLECVLEKTKEGVVAEAIKVQTMALPEEAQEKIILRATDGLTFFNTSPMDLGKMGQNGIKANLEKYIQSFSRDAREVFEHFKFSEFISQLDEANLLFKIVNKFASTVLSPKAISNHEMGLVFEELIRRFAESSNETAGEHFTPRDIVRLTTSLVFMEDDDALSKEGVIRTVYDPTCGTGGFLSSGMEYVHELNPNAVMRAFGQELNPESYAICKADMLIKGQDVSRIKLGNTLSNDQLPHDQFDYMLSNPPFGVDWKKIEGDISDEYLQKGFNGRFGPGLPRVSDGSLLFLLHLISKMRDGGTANNGGRIGIILNGSPLFTGGAGSGESEIRRYILEADLLEGIVALPTEMFYNTGIATYVWILSNKKTAERKGKVQLIDGTKLCGRMRKSLGDKRNQMDEAHIALITRSFGEFQAIDNRQANITSPYACKIFNSTEFGYRRLTIERPLRLTAQITDEAISSLRFAPKPYNAPMESLYEAFAHLWQDSNYGDFTSIEAEARAIVKADFAELKDKQIKDLLDSALWLNQCDLMHKAQQIQTALGTQEGGKAQASNDFNTFQFRLKAAIKAAGIKLDAKENKQFIDAITCKNPDAEPVIKKVLKEEAQPLYGAFDYQGSVVEFEPDSDLRDNENVPLNPSVATSDLIESYFKTEVLPHVADAWINADKRDAKDSEVGIVGYEIPFNRHFYTYTPPRSLEDIDSDLNILAKELGNIETTHLSFANDNKYKKYSHYKNTDVEWLQEIPTHWLSLTGKRVFSSIRKPSLREDEQLAASQKHGVIPQSLMMKLTESRVVLALKGTDTFRHVEKNNFVISLRSFEGGIEHSNYTGCVSPAYTVLKSIITINHQYYKYLLKCSPYIKALQSTTDSLREGKSVNYEQFASVYLPLTDKTEQAKIATFLDEETSKIDFLIENQQKQIELLKERRTALISAAVTGKIDVRDWVAPETPSAQPQDNEEETFA